MDGFTFRVAKKAVALFLLLTVVSYAQALAAPGLNEPESDIDPAIFKIDQKEFLGKKIDKDLLLVDSKGNEFRLGDKLSTPLVLVLSYFRCDGVCPIINIELMEILKGVKRLDIGGQYSVLTLSFDKFDTPETLRMFEEELNLPDEMRKGWEIAMFKNPDDIRNFTDYLGFKYFWSPRDRTFFHPNIYILISPKGRVTRYLFAQTIESLDMEIALLETASEQLRPTQVIDLLVSYCYSYNFKEGKYSLNIPLFIGAGSLALGVLSFVASVFVFKKMRNKREVA